MTTLEEDLKQIEKDWEAVHRLIGAMGLCDFLRALGQGEKIRRDLADMIEAKRKQIDAAMKGTGFKAEWSYRQRACTPAENDGHK